LRDEPIARVVSSPYTRCIESVAPLAKSRGLPVERADELAEGMSLSDGRRLIEKVADQPTVLCTHGDVVENVLTDLDDRRVPLEGGRRSPVEFAKGSTWVLDIDGDDIVGGRYIPPPA
jgi:broad specificity phosphatase PhoE